MPASSALSIPPAAVHLTLDPGYHYGSGFSLLSYALHIGIWAGIVSTLVGPIAGYLCRRVGARIPAIVACALMAVISFGFALATPHYGWLTFALLNGVFGIGFVLFYAAASVLNVDGLPEEQQAEARALCALLSTASATRLDARLLDDAERQLASLSDAIARRYFLQGAEPLRAGGLILA